MVKRVFRRTASIYVPNTTSGKSIRRVLRRCKVFDRAVREGLYDAMAEVMERYGVDHFHAAKVMTKGNYYA